MIVEKSAVNVKELTKNVPAKRPIKQKKYGGYGLWNRQRTTTRLEP